MAEQLAVSWFDELQATWAGDGLETMTLLLPGDTTLPVPTGQWERVQVGRHEKIQAKFTRLELILATLILEPAGDVPPTKPLI